jgi:hypothetical protein
MGMLLEAGWYQKTVLHLSKIPPNEKKLNLQRCVMCTNTDKDEAMVYWCEKWDTGQYSEDYHSKVNN